MELLSNYPHWTSFVHLWGVNPSLTHGNAYATRYVSHGCLPRSLPPSLHTVGLSRTPPSSPDPSPSSHTFPSVVARFLPTLLAALRNYCQVWSNGLTQVRDKLPMEVACSPFTCKTPRQSASARCTPRKIGVANVAGWPNQCPPARSLLIVYTRPLSQCLPSGWQVTALEVVRGRRWGW